MTHIRFANLNLPLRAILPSLLIATLAGAGAAQFSLPLPWMVGPLFAIAALRLAGAPLLAPPGGRQTGQWVIGTTLGLYFTPAVLSQLTLHLPLIGAIALCALPVGMGCALCLRRWTGTDPATAFYCTLPGGASEMTVLAERRGASAERVATAHALRMMLVVVVVPFVIIQAGAHGGDAWVPQTTEVHWQRLPLLAAVSFAGVALFHLIRLPNAWILGALAGIALPTALALPLSALPRELVNSGQLLIGVSLATRFSPTFVRAAPRFILAATACAGLGMICLALLAGVLSWARDVPLATVVLASAPGGVTEMSITAQILHLGVPLVTAAHVLRVIVLSLSAPTACRIFEHWLAQSERVRR